MLRRRASITSCSSECTLCADTACKSCYYLRMNADTHTGMLDDGSEFVELAAEVFTILSDPTRIRIILTLRKEGEMPVGAIANHLDKNPPAISQHLARLRMARMVSTRHEGNRVMYRLADEHALALIEEAVKQAEHAVATGHQPPHHHSQVE